MKRAFILGFILLASACTQAKSPAGTVDGVYRVDGKEAKISFARSYKGEPFNNQPTIEIALTEKDATNAKGPPMFWHDKYGGAVVVTLTKEADGYHVIGSTFLHSALKDGSGNGIGFVSLKDAKEANGEIAGELVTNPNTTLFDQKLDVDLKFKVPMPD